MSEVTVPVQATEVEYLVTTADAGPFAVPFSFFQDADVKVVSVDSAGVSTDLLLTTDWTFTTQEVPAGQEGIGFQSATLTLLVAVSNVTLKIFRNTVIDRVSNFSNTGPFSIVQLNHELSQAIAIMQELRTNKDKYINLPNDSVDSTPWDGEDRAMCNIDESEVDNCAATNRQVDASGPNWLEDTNTEESLGASDQWNNIFTANGLTIQGSITDTTKLFDLMTHFSCIIQNRAGAEAVFYLRYRYTVECYSEIIKATNVAYPFRIDPSTGISFSFMDIEQDIDYFNGLGTLIVAIDIRPVGVNSGNLYAQWKNMAVTTSEPR